MKDLKCGLRECRFNKGYCCCANEITVTNGTDCKSYEFSEEKRQSMFEAAEEFVPSNYTVDTHVNCMAKCVFNKDKKCVANGITVMNDKSKNAVCLTFIQD